MLDDLRNTASEFVEEESRKVEAERPGFLGMTAGQRFVLVFMLFLMVVVLGFIFLFVTDSIYLPLL